MKKINIKIPKNAPNRIKAGYYLGKYMQHEPLLDEMEKMFDFLYPELAARKKKIDNENT